MTERRATYAASEYDHQCALFDWRERNLAQYPELAYLFATLNGIRLTPGVRVKAQRQGMIKGVPDVWLPVPRATHKGMVFEMKAGHNRLTKEQREWLVMLADAGWKTGVYYDWQDAASAIVEYLEDKGG